MPTHIVIRGPPSAMEELDNPRIGDGVDDMVSVSEDDNSSLLEEEPHDYSQGRPNLRRSKTPIRGVVGLRNSCKHSDKKKPPMLQFRNDSDLHLSSSDLRASPRLPGYLYMTVASIVNLVSAVKFYTERESDIVIELRRLEEDPDTQDEQPSDTDTIYGFLVKTWKLYGAIALSATGVAIGLMTVYAHFDTYCLPRVWKAIFRDGSKGERYFLYALLLFWAAGLQICTSSFSVGEAAPNVYFTTWIAFGSVAINIGVWRTSAELPTLADRLWGHKRETMHNWFFVWVFAMINSLAIADVYANRAGKEILVDGEAQNVSQKDWNHALCVTFGANLFSFLNMVCNHCMIKPWRIDCCCGCQMNLDWRQVEGFIALALVGVYSWIIIEFTGVNFPLNRPSNAYFGAWGVFFTSILTFGTWLKENKDIKLFVGKESEEPPEAAPQDSASEETAE